MARPAREIEVKTCLGMMDVNQPLAIQAQRGRQTPEARALRPEGVLKLHLSGDMEALMH